ncbi:hypothetical protein CTAYLR_008017 [Chrysophaeum taylorii]|uniref:L-lactate permease n=1 Tax=Chrysophaeum taylorii TaxID=2483200 RepID=A0AAD7UAZ9_9STRA|nr:hypothetical protein CTAYLR_008017 [Chrysophaeum taylorii]
MAGFWDVFFGLAPIGLLIALTFKGLPTSTTLPVAAIALYLVALIYFKYEANLMNAYVVKGLGDSLTTIAIVFGAICLFEALKMTGALDWLTSKLREFSRGAQAAQVFLIAWAFAYLIEGCSGFGTPTALAAPLLVEMGYDPQAAVVCCLVMNTLATPFGAAGTPIWFGLDGLADDDNLQIVGFWAQAVCLTAAHAVPLLAAAALVPASALASSWRTIAVCIYSCAGVAFAVSAFSYELPTLLGGGVGLVVSALYVKTTNTPPDKFLKEIVDSLRSATGSFRDRALARREPTRVDEKDDDRPAPVDLVREESLITMEIEENPPDDDEENPPPTWKYVFPLAMVVFFLTLTRFPIIDIKDELKSQRPKARVRLGSLGEFWLSSALVVGLSDVYREPVSTTFEILYVPAFLPFFMVSVATLYVFGMISQTPLLLKKTWARTASVILPIASALVLASLMRAGVAADLSRPMMSSFGKAGWILVTPLFGVLGSFFSGSTTVSNLTFGSIQLLAADRLGLNKLHLLALQTVGATIGNCICLQNIIQAKAVVGLTTLESVFIKHTFKPALLFVGFAWIWGFILLAL